MNRLHAILLVAVSLCMPAAATEWKPASNPLMTRWSAQVDPKNPLPDYPRPQLQRPAWQNLNGLWGCAVQPKDAPQRRCR